MLDYQKTSLTVLQRRGFSLAATKSILHDSRAFLRTLVLYARTYTSWKDAAYWFHYRCGIKLPA
jgi:hypothetical protein